MNSGLSQTEKEFWEKYKVDLMQGYELCLENGMFLAAGKILFCAFDSLAAFYIGYDDTKRKSERVLSGGGGRSKGNIYEYSDVGKCFDNYLKNCCGAIYRQAVTVNSRKEALRTILYQDYRCGLVHEGRPKRNLGLDKNKNDLFRDGKLSLAILNEILLESVKKFDYQLDTKDYRVRRWRERHRYLSINY